LLKKSAKPAPTKRDDKSGQGKSGPTPPLPAVESVKSGKPSARPHPRLNPVPEEDPSSPSSGSGSSSSGSSSSGSSNSETSNSKSSSDEDRSKSPAKSPGEWQRTESPSEQSHWTGLDSYAPYEDEAAAKAKPKPYDPYDELDYGEEEEGGTNEREERGRSKSRSAERKKRRSVKRDGGAERSRSCERSRRKSRGRSANHRSRSRDRAKRKSRGKTPPQSDNMVEDELAEESFDDADELFTRCPQLQTLCGDYLEQKRQCVEKGKKLEEERSAIALEVENQRVAFNLIKADPGRGSLANTVKMQKIKSMHLDATECCEW
jgi:hypothetical protein